MRRLVAIVLMSLVAGNLVAGSSAADTSACSGQMARAIRAAGLERIPLRSLHIEAEADKKAYSLGEVATVKVNVTRPAKEDPAGQGIPIDRPISEPAEEVFVGVGLSIGRVFLAGAGVTDAKGNAKVKIKIERYAPRNTIVDASVYAWKIIHENTCFTVLEEGYRVYPRYFRTSP